MQHFESKSPFLPEILGLHAKWRKEQEAVICGETRLNWGEMIAASNRLANGLLDLGIKPGERVGVVMSNGFPMLQSLLALMTCGVASVPINLSVNDEGLVSMLDDAGVVALICTSDQLPRINSVRTKLNQRVKHFLSDGPSDDWISIDSLCERASVDMPDVKISGADILNIIYSSGTTGMPKGIVHTHKGRRDWAYDLAIALRYHCNARTLLTIGLYSNISWVAMLTTLLAGGTLVIHKVFSAEAFIETVEQEAVTHTAMVPIQFQRVVEAVQASGDSRDLSSMQAMMSCGSPLHVDIKKHLFDVFACGIIELYGLTEGVITTLEPEQALTRLASVGRPLLGTDICIVSDQNQIVGVGESGEICSRGRITMPGYLNRQEANESSTFVDDQGKQWIRTGDIGYVDDEGYLYIVDRKKDMILSGGQNIYPQDIEAVIKTNAEVNDVAVIGAVSAKWGETPVALIVLEADADIGADELKSWSNERLGKQQRISDVIFIEELPRNPNGKILKRELRKQYQNLQYH